MATRIMQGDVFAVLPTLPPRSADVVVTSPPYWMLRSYIPKGHPLKPLELGSEPTPEKYVENMVRVMRLVREVLADHGTVWLNVGDTYSGGGGGNYGNGKSVRSQGGQQHTNILNRGGFGIDAGNLCLIPQRLAIGLQEDGWIVRSIVVWHKPAPMPSSVSGWMWRRCRVKVKAQGKPRQPSRADVAGTVQGRSRDYNGTDGWIGGPEWSDCPGCKKCDPHGGYVLRRGSWRPTSSWEPILMLAKGPGYFADGIAVETPAASATLSRNDYTRVIDDPDEQFAVKHDHETEVTTANLRDVWTISAEPLRAKHYAAFPSELVHRCLKAGTSTRGYCPTCDAPWCRVVETGKGDEEAAARPKHLQSAKSTLSLSGNGSAEWAERGTRTKTVDWRPTCSCPPHEPRPGRVLDPFAGSGRVGDECLRLGLDFVGVELSDEYATMATKRLRDQSPLFA